MTNPAKRRPTWQDGVEAMRDHIEFQTSRHMRWGPFSWWTSITWGLGDAGGFYAWTQRGAKRRAARIARRIRRDEQARRDATRWQA